MTAKDVLLAIQMPCVIRISVIWMSVTVLRYQMMPKDYILIANMPIIILSIIWLNVAAAY
jgi:hypothetical protein